MAVPHPVPLHDLRLLGAGRAAALVGADATVWWLVAPEPDGPVPLWGLLDPAGPRARWVSAEPSWRSDRYVGPTLDATVTVDGRPVRVRDGLLAHDDGVSLVRLARTTSGSTTVDHELALGGFDGPAVTWAVIDGVARAELAGGPVRLRGGTTTVHGATARTSLPVDDGRWSALVLTFGAEPPGVRDPTSGEAWAGALADAEERFDRELWRARLPREHSDRTATALRVVRALSDHRSGAVLASVTTSLPEALDGDRQFDYRFTWLRDSAMAASTCADVGLPQLADAALGFLARTVEEEGADVCPVRTVRGTAVPEERELDHVAGYAGARPVRVGNAAADQRQHDALGSYADAVWSHVKAGGRTPAAARRSVLDLADKVAAEDGEPSSGIWEVREPRRFVSEDVGRWIVLDRAHRLAWWSGRPWRTLRWRRERRRLARRVLGTIRPDGSMPQTYDGDDVTDAACLLVVLSGLLDRRDRRAARLVDVTIERLGEGPFLRRYDDPDDGFHGREGAFLPTSWWAVAALARTGRVDEASERADAMCIALPELLAEEVDAERGTLLGNLPLLWTHTEAARALHLLHEEQVRRRTGTVGLAAWKAWRFARIRVDGRPVRPAAVPAEG